MPGQTTAEKNRRNMNGEGVNKHERGSCTTQNLAWYIVSQFVLAPIDFLSVLRPHHPQASGTAPGAGPRRPAQTPWCRPPSS